MTTSDDTGAVQRAVLWHPRLILVALLLLATLLLLPVVVTILLSCQLNDSADPFSGPFGAEAWTSMLSNAALWPLLGKSLGMAALIGLIANLLAIGPAYVAAIIGGRWRQLVLMLSLAVFLGDQVTVVMGWSEISRQITRWLVDPDASSGRYVIGDLMTFLAELHHALPLAIFCQSWAMRRYDPALIEAGLECGAYHGRLLRIVIAPLLWPGVIAGWLSGFAFSLGASLEPALLNTGVMSWGEQVQQALELDSDWPQGARLALIALLFILAAGLISAGLLMRLMRRDHDRTFRRGNPADPIRRFPVDWRDPIIHWAVISLIFLAAPLICMLLLSLRYLASIGITAGPGLFIRALIGDPHLFSAIGTSLITALTAALLATGGGAGLAMLWRHLLATARSRWWLWPVLLLTALPLLLPSLLLSTIHLIAHVFLTLYLPSGLGIVAVALADALRAMPLVALVLLVFWRRLPHNLDETAHEFRLDTGRMQRLILQPSLQPAWAVAILVSVMLALGDFQLANALSGDRVMLGPTLLGGIATQRSPIYLALTGPLLGLTVWFCRLILQRLDRRDPARAPRGSGSGYGLSLNITARKT